MSVKLLTEHHLEFFSDQREAAQARLSLHLSKCQIVGNHMSQPIYFLMTILFCIPVHIFLELLELHRLPLLRSVQVHPLENPQRMALRVAD